MNLLLFRSIFFYRWSKNFIFIPGKNVLPNNNDLLFCPHLLYRWARPLGLCPLSRSTAMTWVRTVSLAWSTSTSCCRASAGTRTRSTVSSKCCDAELLTCCRRCAEAGHVLMFLPWNFLNSSVISEECFILIRVKRVMLNVSLKRSHISPGQNIVCCKNLAFILE